MNEAVNHTSDEIINRASFSVDPIIDLVIREFSEPWSAINTVFGDYVFLFDGGGNCIKINTVAQVTFPRERNPVGFAQQDMLPRILRRKYERPDLVRLYGNQATSRIFFARFGKFWMVTNEDLFLKEALAQERCFEGQKGDVRYPGEGEIPYVFIKKNDSSHWYTGLFDYHRTIL
jgi:hypothetical protein